MDFMNLNQAAHGDREHGFIGARLRKARKIIADAEDRSRQLCQVANEYAEDALARTEEAVQAAQESEFLHRVLPEELSHRYYEEELKRCAALKAAADPAEYERVHYFNAI